jgi:hypothetical protein
MQAEGGLYIVCTRLAPTDLSLVGWVRLRGCIIGIRKCLHPRQGALCFGQARTQPNRAVRSAHQAFVPRHGSCEPRKVDNGELSRINPSRQIVPGPTRNIHPVSTRQSCRDGQGTAVLQNNKAAEKVRPALPRGSTPASTASNFSQPATQHHSTPTTPARYTYRPLREASHQANSPRGKPIAAPPRAWSRSAARHHTDTHTPPKPRRPRLPFAWWNRCVCACIQPLPDQPPLYFCPKEKMPGRWHRNIFKTLPILYCE